MADTGTPARYARALVEIAQEDGLLDRFSQDVQNLSSVFNDRQNGLVEALSHPGFSQEERMGVLNAVLDLYKLHPLVVSFLRVVQDKGRARLLPAIFDEYNRLADTAAGRVRVKLTTASPLHEGLRVEVRAAMERATGRQVVLDERVNPDIIGGLVAEVEGRVWDASLRARLDDLRSQMLQASPSLNA